MSSKPLKPTSPVRSAFCDLSLTNSPKSIHSEPSPVTLLRTRNYFLKYKNLNINEKLLYSELSEKFMEFGINILVFLCSASKINNFYVFLKVNSKKNFSIKQLTIDQSVPRTIGPSRIKFKWFKKLWRMPWDYQNLFQKNYEKLYSAMINQNNEKVMKEYFQIWIKENSEAKIVQKIKKNVIENESDIVKRENFRKNNEFEGESYESNSEKSQENEECYEEHIENMKKVEEIPQNVSNFELGIKRFRENFEDVIQDFKEKIIDHDLNFLELENLNLKEELNSIKKKMNLQQEIQSQEIKFLKDKLNAYKSLIAIAQKRNECMNNLAFFLSLLD